MGNKVGEKIAVFICPVLESPASPNPVVSEVRREQLFSALGLPIWPRQSALLREVFAGNVYKTFT